MFLNLTPKNPKSAKKAPNLTESKTKSNTVLRKQKLIVYISRIQKCVLSLILTPKIAPKGPKRAPNLVEVKAKR